MLEKEKNERERNRMVSAAYTAWLMGSGEKRTFGQYLRGLGLAEKERPLDPDQKKVIADKAHKIAARIMAMGRKNNERNIPTRRKHHR